MTLTILSPSARVVANQRHLDHNDVGDLALVRCAWHLAL
jgi:hypothetical protein